MRGTAKTNSVSVVLSPALVALFPGATTRLVLEAHTVADLVDALDARWPGMGDRLRDTTPAIRRHINIFCDGARGTLQTRLSDGAQVYVLTAVSGG